MRKLNNDEFMQRVMNYSPYGGLVQAFVLQALINTCEAIKEAGPEALETPLVSGKAWHGCAVDILRQYEENYR